MSGIVGCVRRAAQGRIPDNLLHRNDKKGFEALQGARLSGPLRRWAEGILNSSQLRLRGWLDPAMAQQVWKQFLNCPAKYHSLIFRWPSLETWNSFPQARKLVAGASGSKSRPFRLPRRKRSCPDFRMVAATVLRHHTAFVCPTVPPGGLPKQSENTLPW
jgi:hypothetical protein